MCWAVPARVVRVEGMLAQVDFGGAVRTVVVAAEGVKEGDIVLVHAGAIIGKVRPEDFAESIKLYAELALETALQSGLSRKEAEELVKRQLSAWERWLRGE